MSGASSLGYVKQLGHAVDRAGLLLVFESLNLLEPGFSFLGNP